MILDRFDATGQVAVVTGAGRGIGERCATALAEVGADVVCAARTAEQIEDTADQVRARGRRALAVRCDVTQRSDLEQLVESTLDEFGRIDILVNNAGGWPPQELLQTSEAAFEDAFHFNVTSAFVLTRLAAPRLAEGDGGAIVNISSRAGSIVQPGFAAYGTSKAALSFLTRTSAPELAPKVRINAIEAGAVETSALEFIKTDPEIERQLVENTPMRRLGHVDDVATMAVYLTTPASSYVTGKIFAVDGGIEHPQFEFPTTPL